MMLVFLCSHVMGMLHITDAFILILVCTNTIALCLGGLGESPHTCRSSESAYIVVRVRMRELAQHGCVHDRR